MFFKKKLPKPDPKAEQELRDEIEREGGLEKNDIAAMIISAMMVFLPVAIVILALFALIAFLMF